MQRGSRSEKKDMKRKTWIAVLVLLCFIAVSDVNTGILSGKPSFCLAGPIAIARIAGKEDFLNWYQSDSANGGFAVLTADLVIDGKVELGMEQGNAGRRRELNTRDFTIRIANKGQLTVDNPDLYFMGNKEIMTVESGGRLSTGEKQLISFARAILANPSIFVLDEATSSIDTQTEQLIQEATDQLLKGHTSFVIAHRLSTIRQADLILVVKDGKIIEEGSHRELLRQKGYYYDLYSRQFEEESAMQILAGEKGI